jgi:hypothetical protein
MTITATIATIRIELRTGAERFCICAASQVPTVSGASTAGTQSAADVQLARWNAAGRTPSVPANNGTTMRAGPTKRETNTASAPQRLKKR